MKVILFNALLSFAVSDHVNQRFSDSFLDGALVEDLVPDLAGRRRVVVRHMETNELVALWVQYDRESRLPLVWDPLTHLPYLLRHKEQTLTSQLYRIFRGKSNRLVVTEQEVLGLYHPIINKFGGVDLQQITENEAGFTLKIFCLAQNNV